MALSKVSKKIRQICLILLLLHVTRLAPTSVMAKPILRHVEGFNGLALRGGIIPIGNFFALDWSYQMYTDWGVKLGLGLGFKDFQKFSYKHFFSDPTLSYKLFGNHKNLFIHTTGGMIFCCDQKAKDKYDFNVGLIFGGDICFFVIDRLEIFSDAALRIFFIQSKAGILGYVFGLGLRYSF